MKNITIIEQLNGFQYTFFDTSHSSLLREFQGFEYAEAKVSIDDVSGAYGSVYITSKHSSRRFSIVGDLVGDTVFTNRRTVSNALRQTGTIKLIKFTTYDDLALQCEAEVVKYVNEYNHKIHTFLIEFQAPDWRFYSQELLSQDIMETSIQGGAAIPATIPMAITQRSAGNEQVNHILDNVGNENTDPVITIAGPGTDFTLRNNTTDQDLLITDTLSDTDELVIDVKNRTVVLNGITNLYPSISGEFWSLIPGENEIQFFIVSGLDQALTSLNVQFRAAYNGV